MTTQAGIADSIGPLLRNRQQHREQRGAAKEGEGRSHRRRCHTEQWWPVGAGGTSVERFAGLMPADRDVGVNLLSTAWRTPFQVHTFVRRPSSQ